MRLAALMGPIAACAVAVGCADGEWGDAPVRAVATTSQAADLVREVGGGRVAVRELLRQGGDPHGYEPRPSDVRAIAEADVLVRSGGDVDDWLDELVDDAGAEAPVLTLLDTAHPLRRADGDVDPHWWQDPRNAERAVGAIEQKLRQADPAARRGYARRARAYRRRLRRLDAQLANCFGRLPPARRRIVTTHDALGYLARRYGIEIVGSVIPSLSTQAQPSAGDVQELVEQIEKERVPAVFPEAAVSEKLERAISRESGAAVGGELWTDSLGGEGSGAETYVGAMRANADALVAGMSGGSAGCP